MKLILSNSKVDVYNLSYGQTDLGGQVTTQPQEAPHKQDAKDWVLCYPENGKYNNLYLEQLALRALRSTTHADCLNKRLNFFLGKGITTEDEAWSNTHSELNAYGESLQDLVSKDFKDTDWAGNSYIEIVKISQNEYQFYHRTPQGFRASKKVQMEKTKGYWYSGDWTKYNTDPKYYQPIFYPSFPNFGIVKNIDGTEQPYERSIAHFKSYDPRSQFYGRPHYVSAINDIDIEYRISKYNLDEFDNGFRADMVMTVFKNVKDQKEFEEAKNEIKDQHTGEGNNGGFIIETVDPIDGKPAVLQRVDRTTDGQFHAESERAERNILKAHNMTKSLASITTNGQLGSNQQLITEWELFEATESIPFRQAKFRWYNYLFERTIGAPNEPFKIPTIPPVSKVDGIDPKLVLGIKEQREELGQPREMAEDDELLKTTNGTNNSKSGNQ